MAYEHIPEAEDKPDWVPTALDGQPAYEPPSGVKWRIYCSDPDSIDANNPQDGEFLSYSNLSHPDPTALAIFINGKYEGLDTVQVIMQYRPDGMIKPIDNETKYAYRNNAWAPLEADSYQELVNEHGAANIPFPIIRGRYVPDPTFEYIQKVAWADPDFLKSS